MKIKRCLLAVAVTVTAAACSRDVTAPDAALRAQQSGAAALEEATTTSTSTTTTIEPVEVDSGDTGSAGSGCCKS